MPALLQRPSLTAAMPTLLQRPFLTATASLAACALFAFLGFDSGVDRLQAFARYTGRAGLLWFALVFAVAPMHGLAPGPLTRIAMRRRRRLGLAFAYHHGVHLAALLTYLRASGHELDPGRAAGGMAGYVAIALMAVTSNDAAVRRLGARTWKMLHRGGLWYLWLVFGLTYGPRLGRAETTAADAAIFTAALILLAALALLRVGAALRTRT